MSLPTYITLFRFLLIPLIYAFIAYYTNEKDHMRLFALTLFTLASVTDALDGFIARRWNLRTTLGTFLDPLADKLLLVSAFVGISVSSLPLKPPLWVVIVVVFRDLFLVAGLFIIYLTTQKISLEPNVLGKTTTFSQMVTIVFILMQIPLAPIFWFLTAALTVASGIVYVLSGLRQLHESNLL